MSNLPPPPPSIDTSDNKVVSEVKRRGRPYSMGRKSIVTVTGDFVTEEIDDKWANAIQTLDTSNLVKMMLETVSHMPYKIKKELKASGDHQVVQKILLQMNDLLDLKFLQIDFDSLPRDVKSNDWSKIVSCRRSESGTTDLYDSGGSSSPKTLFSSQGILLMELVKGKPLCHRTQGQRQLQDEDYRAIGRLFLLDLIIRNTDRLPCRKAMPRPGVVAIIDQGNAGNLMFGDEPGSLWAIDPEMQTHINLTKESEYAQSLESIVYEIINDERSQLTYKQLESLYYVPVSGLSGVLDHSLDEITPWFYRNESSLQSQSISSILNLIRIRAQAENNAIIVRANSNPPDSDNEREWREWIRISTPRTIDDILKFIELQTGFTVPATAPSKFAQGFLEALAGAISFLREAKNPLGKLAIKHPTLLRIILSNNHIDVSFIIRMIEKFVDYENKLPFPNPTSTCDERSSGNVSPMRLKFISAAMKVVSLNKNGI
eukprot:gene19324-25188_t